MLLKFFYETIVAMGISLTALPVPPMFVAPFFDAGLPRHAQRIDAREIDLSSDVFELLLGAEVETRAGQPVGCVGSVEMAADGQVTGAVVWLTPDRVFGTAKPVVLPAQDLTVEAKPVQGVRVSFRS